MANKIQLRRGLKANLPVLSVGEPALCLDTKEVYIGSGIGNIKIYNESEIDGQINTINNNAKSINTEVSILKGDKYIFIGDSYGSGWTVEGTIINWIDKTIEMLGIQNSSYKNSTGGAGFNNNGYLNLLKDIEATIPNKSEVKNIVIGGGFNDKNSISNIGSTMKAFFDYVKPKFPNAKIIICPIGWAVEGMTTGAHAGAKTSDLIDMVLEYQRGALKNGGTYVNGICNSLHSKSFFSSDYVHPNADGQYNIALYLSNYLKGGGTSFNGEYAKENCFSDIVLDNQITSNSVSANVVTYSETSTIQLSAGNILIGTPMTIKCNGTEYKIGKLRNASINGYKKGTVLKGNFVIETTVSSKLTYYKIDGNFVISGGELRVLFVEVNETKTDFLTLSNVTKIIVTGYSPSVTVNSLLN